MKAGFETHERISNSEMFVIVLSLLFLSFVWHSHWAEFLLHIGSSEKTCEFQKIMYSSCLEGIHTKAGSQQRFPPDLQGFISL